LSAVEVGRHVGPVDAEPLGELIDAVASAVRGDQLIHLGPHPPGSGFGPDRSFWVTD
jgi:hypothetical protein